MSSDDFVFPITSPEFAELYNLFCVWALETRLAPFSDCTTGEAVTLLFEKHVRTQHSALAERVVRDPSIYEAVAMEWSDNQD